jgi:hypothetical protein
MKIVYVWIDKISQKIHHAFTVWHLLLLVSPSNDSLNLIRQCIGHLTDNDYKPC